MSRLGKLPVEVPASVTAEIKGNACTVKSGNTQLTTKFTGDVVVTLESGKIWVKPANDSKRARTMWGTTRANILNLVKGVTQGFSKKLEINGVGFRAAVQGNMLTLTLGFSHDIRYVLPEGVTAKVTQNVIEISGADRQRVGQVAAELRSLRKPEPYKGKGVKYTDENIRRKEGKKK